MQNKRCCAGVVAPSWALPLAPFLVLFLALSLICVGSPARAQGNWYTEMNADAVPATDIQKIGPYSTFKLENGLQVVVAPDFRSPVVVHMVVYRAGGVDEPAGESGIAHMLEHMMFKGTPTVPAGEFSKTIQRLGGQDNAFTTADFTAYHQKLSRDNLAEAVKMEADRMANLQINDKTFTPEHQVVLEERNMRIDSQPVNSFFEAFNAKQYNVLPYRKPVIGWRPEMEAYTVAKANNWYHNFYAPNNAIVVFAGAITPEEAEWVARTYYGPIPARPIKPLTTIPTEPEHAQPTRFTQLDPRVQVPVFVRSYRAPSLHAGVAGAPVPPAKDDYALMILADALGGGQASRLYQTLVVKDKLADGASASYSPVARLESTFDIHVSPKVDADMGKVEAAVDGVLDDVRAHGITEAELKRAKMNIKSSDLYARDDLFNTAYKLGTWLATGGTLKSYADWLPTLEKVTLADVSRMADRVLQRPRRTTGLLLPEKTQEK